jgi:SAM-dependent methyltransferase
MEIESVDCPVCGPSQTKVWLASDSPARYVRCLQCNTVFASPRLSRSIRYSNEETVWEYSQELLTREALRIPALKQEAEYIQRHVQCGRLLDIGCSSGDFFNFFPEPAWERSGVELSASATEYTSRAYNADVRAGTLCSAHWTRASFDLVTFIDMLYLVDDPRAEMKEARRILKPNGIVAIEISGQAYMFLRSRGLIALMMERRWCRLNPDTHLYWFTPDSLTRLLASCGLQPFAWYMTRSQARPDSFTNFLASAYYAIFSSMAGNSTRLLNWAPKYLCLARRTDDSL